MVDLGDTVESTTNNDFMKPEKPSELDCCNSGCNPCVFDIYEIRLAEWTNRIISDRNSIETRYDLLSETKFKPFILLEKVKVGSNIYFFKFQPYILNSICDSACSIGFKQNNISGVLPYGPGQHFIIKCPEQQYLSELSDKNVNLKTPQEAFVTRAYTPISLSSDELDCIFCIVVKVYANGLMSNYFSKLNIGDVTYFRGPFGNFQYMPNSYRSVLMICMGTGIAPIYAIIKHILRDESDETLLKLLYGCSRANEIILRDELKNMALYWNFSVKYFITNQDSQFSEKFGESFVFHRINDLEIGKELSEKSSRLVLICGSKEFNETILSVVLKFGMDRKDVHVF